MENRNFFLGLFAMAVVLFTSCAKLPIYQSKKAESGIQVNATSHIADRYYLKKGIDFGTTGDDKYLYAQVCFHNQTDLSKIQSNGLKLYFDKACKKKKDWILSIEKSERMGPAMASLGDKASSDFSMNNMQNGGMSAGSPPSGEMPLHNSKQDQKDSNDQFSPIGWSGASGMNTKAADMICKSMEKVTWKKGDTEYIFYCNYYRDEIIVKLEPYKESYLMLTVRMPLSELEIESGDKIAMGIETGKSSDSSSNSSGGGPVGGSMGGGPGMGGDPGMGRGPGGPGGMDGGMQSGSQSSGSQFKFWFLAQL